MNSIGFPIPRKENENRRAILPIDIRSLAHPEQVFVERGYGEPLQIGDEEYASAGARLVSFDEVLDQDVICDPKIGSAPYLKELRYKTVFGWIHAVQGKAITDLLVQNQLTAIAWEDMFESDGRHSFWSNNEIAGRAAINHALQCHPFNHTPRAAVIGRGNTARGAVAALEALHIPYRQFTRTEEDLLRRDLGEYDLVVCAILWDIFRKDHLITRDDLKRMPSGALIVDIACDKAGAIETSVPTSIDHPCYVVDGITHYVVDHTPTLLFKEASESISRALAPHLDSLMEGHLDKCLQEALIMENGTILDHRIIDYQGRLNA